MKIDSPTSQAVLRSNMQAWFHWRNSASRSSSRLDLCSLEDDGADTPVWTRKQRVAGLEDAVLQLASVSYRTGSQCHS